MACFIVPAAEAIVTTAVHKIVKRKEDNNGTEKTSRFSEKLSVLNGLLWGGSGLLAFEHVWHGEIIPSFPFLTAASDPAQTADNISEYLISAVERLSKLDIPTLLINRYKKFRKIGVFSE